VKPCLLDLYCGAGGASMGYSRAGFDVVGVDHRPQPSYPFDFVQGHALAVLGDLIATDEIGGFVAIHASPPCQRFTAYRRAHTKQRDYGDWIGPTRALLIESALPYVIENVPRAPLRAPYTLCGVSVGLAVKRHRLFETSFDMTVPPCACGGWQPAQYDRGSRHIRPNDRRTVAIGEWRIPLALQREAMGIDWMSVGELSQAIPPRYTELIGAQLLDRLSWRWRGEQLTLDDAAVGE